MPRLGASAFVHDDVHIHDDVHVHVLDIVFDLDLDLVVVFDLDGIILVLRPSPGGSIAAPWR